MTKGSTLRKTDGFTLIEIMIVAFVLGIIVSVAVPAFTKARANARATSFSSDIKTLYFAAESYSMETGLWAPSTAPGTFPAELDGYISSRMFEAETSMGGN